MAETLLLRNADLLCTMQPVGRMTSRAGDDGGREIPGGGLFARDGVIEAVGAGDELPDDADIVLDMQGHVVIPGMVNTHHHLFQNLTRAVPAAQNAPLFGWLQTLYPIWSHIRPDHIYWSTALGLAELALSGCTTSSDHLYLYPNGARLDDSMAAAADIGVRFHGTRGSMSIGESGGGLPPDILCWDEADILADCQRVVLSGLCTRCASGASALAVTDAQPMPRAKAEAVAGVYAKWMPVMARVALPQN